MTAVSSCIGECSKVDDAAEEEAVELPVKCPLCLLVGKEIEKLVKKKHVTEDKVAEEAAKVR